MSTLLLVHAHPDDEAISSGGVIARAHDWGHRVVLVTCTGGEAGEIHNMDEASVRPRLKEVRAAELRAAAGILGIDRLIDLGYRDSGMAGTEDNDNPASFHRAPTEDAASTLAAIILEERPEVVVTYGADGIYGHPDHVKAHHVTVAAVDMLARSNQAPEKLYFIAIPRSGLARMSEQFRERGLADAFSQEDRPTLILGTPDEEITTVVDCSAYVDRKKRAFMAHTSQMAPDSFFLNTPEDLFNTMFGTECFVVARGATGQVPESDLFAGLEEA